MTKKLTLPNALSILRLFMIPVLLMLIFRFHSSRFPLLLFCYFFTIFLDFLDGFLARKLNQESEFGKILDPVADKLLVLGLLFSLLIKTDFPIWLAVLIVLRDLVILCASVMLLRGRGEVKESLPVGKVTFALLGLLIFFYLFDLPEAFDFSIIKDFLIPLSFAFIVWSGLEYFWVYRCEKALLSAQKKDP